jgi:murein DD-endopeptidase MepM/ murein hydrolase activator NlpD
MALGRRESRAEPRPLEFLAFRSAFDMKLEVKRGSDGALAVTRIPIRIDNPPLRVTGEVGASLTRAARAAGVPAHIVAEYVKQMSYVVDFQREVRGRDRFDFIIAHRRAETGETEMGQLLYAGLQNGKQQIALMRFGDKGQFFRESGEGARRGLMRTPVDGARLSSGFGMRFHPVLGYSRMHQGVDFAAPSGTPVLASATGRVVGAGWGGGYGNVVRLDHGKGFTTRYAHLSRILVRAGQSVSQGQVIGHVGTTGLSTGPHLHYEVWQGSKPVDPRSARFQGGVQLSGADLARFKAEMARLKQVAASGG